MRATPIALLPLAAGAAAQGYPTPPPPPSTPCVCGKDYPFCWRDGCDNSGNCWDNYCYHSENSNTKSETECPGKCTSSFIAPTPVPGVVPPHGTPPPGEVAPMCDPTASAQEQCADFCSYKCSFYNTSMGDTGRPRNITVIRITPKNVTGPADKNTADPPGDVSFVLSKKNITQQCIHEPGSMGCHTDNEVQDLYGVFVIEVDGQWGPYQMCNPANGYDTANWKCGLDCMQPTETGCGDNGYGHRNGSGYGGGVQCWCPRTYVSVGRENAPSHHGYHCYGHSCAKPPPASWPPQCASGTFNHASDGYCYDGEVLSTMTAWDFASASTMACKGCSADSRCSGWAVAQQDQWSVTLFTGNLSSKKCQGSEADGAYKMPPSRYSGGNSWYGVGDLGGVWYSHTSVGQCAPGEPLGTDGCTWRLVETKPYKNATCVDTKADAAVVEHGKACFDQCPQPLDRFTDCYLDCYRNTLLGDASLNITKPPPSLLVDPWRAALESTEADGGCPAVTPGPLDQ